MRKTFLSNYSTERDIHIKSSVYHKLNLRSKRISLILNSIETIVEKKKKKKIL